MIESNQIIRPEDTKIGWIGTGVMGAKMCGHLLQAGHQITVFNRTRSKAEDLINGGAHWADNPAEVADSSDIIFSIVGFPGDVRETHLGKRGTLAGCSGTEILVDMTTSSPQLAIEIFNVAQQKNVQSLDAPVSGGDVGAKNGTLSIMVGGDEQVFHRLTPLFQKMGQTFVYQGAAGSGQHTKMVNQTLIATNMIGVCEALIYAHRAGLNLETVLKSVSSGAAGSWSLSNLGTRIIGNDFDPGFFVDHFIKDMGIALSEANRMGLSLPGLALARQLYETVVAIGHKKSGTQALHLALCTMSAIDWCDR